MTRGALRAVVVALCVAAPHLPVPSTVADDGIPIDLGQDTECLGLAPHVPATLPAGAPIRADVVVALDGVSEDQAFVELAKVSSLYATGGEFRQLSPNIDLNFVAFHDLTGQLTSSEVDSHVIEENPAGDDLMSQLIRYYRTNFPDLPRDHVLLLTTKDLVTTSGLNVGGIANCIGSIGSGISYSISEIEYGNEVDFALQFFFDLNAIAVAHELGHAFGAHHHYAMCGMTVVTGLLKRRFDACTLMINDAGLATLQFSPLEAAAVRGSAEVHLAD